MSSHQQFTIGDCVSFEGVGLHTGCPSRVSVMPSQSGILEGVRLGQRFALDTDAVSQTARCTTVGHGENGVSTVEHLLGALAGMGIGSADILFDGPEVPILDGSALGFVKAIAGAGRQPSGVPARSLRLTRPVWMEEGTTSYIATPAGEFRLTVAVDFPHPLIGRQVFEMEITPETFQNEIAPARTFGFEAELEELRRRGLAQGGSLENALVFLNDGSSTPLRFPDEPARHKMLDVIGDLALLGAVPLAHVCAVRPSHRWNAAFARLLKENGTMCGA